MKIEAPTFCPSCDTGLVAKNDILYCINKDCAATSAKRVEHFAKTMKIKGLGPAAIEKLELNGIEEIYDIDISYMTFSLGSAKIAMKLFDEIENSKKQQLNTLLPAFGIPLIGKTAADKLSKVCDSIFDIDEETCRSAGLGEKATANLINWLEHDFSKYENLPFSFEFSHNPVEQKKGVICISGKLNSFKTKAEATTVLESMGYTVKSSMTKDVSILVSEEGRVTAKTQKAEELGIQIVNNLKNFIGENNDPT